MSDTSSAVKNLRERLAGVSEDRLGKALTELLDNPLLIGTIERASTAREKAAQAQELAMGAFNIPSAADIERLTRRLRSVSQRLEGIEDGMQRLDRALASRGIDSSQIGERLSKIEQQLGVLSARLSERAAQSPAAASGAAATAKRSPSGKTSPARKASPSRSSKSGSPGRRKATPKKS
jgi:predicted  nucleic acid-binding Zn-ribbon protein